MTKIRLIPVLLLLSLALSACGAPFTAGELFTPTGEAGDAQASAGGAAGGGTGGNHSGGALSQAGESGTGGSGMGGALSQGTPCADPVDTVSPGYLALGTATCYRTKESFDTLTCSQTVGWAVRTIRVNGQEALCNKKQTFPPAIGGYNYFEITGAPPAADWIRWSVAGTDGGACWEPYDRAHCDKYTLNDAVNYNGRNWICSSPDCALCQKDAACEPSGLCPSGVVWMEEGTCQ
jgi:hypothetical protein